MELNSIVNSKKPLGKQLREYVKKAVTWDWIFSTVFEKIILVACFSFSIYSFLKFILEGLF